MPKKIQPKADLNTFYSRVKQPLPTYKVREVPDGFQCTVVIAAVQGEGNSGGFSEKSFEGETVKRKKDASQANSLDH